MKAANKFCRAISRRDFLGLSSAAIASSFTLPHVLSPNRVQAHSSDIIAGAIRWDAWYKQADASISAQRSLSAQRYYKRAPFFCDVSKDAQVSCLGSPAEMNDEIHAAVKGGLKYWAFDWYAADSSLHAAWTLYDQSPNRNQLNWCGIVGLANLGSVPFKNDKWQDNMREWAGYMREPHYQRVNSAGEKRPLLYLLWDQTQVQSYFDGDLSNIKKSFAYLTQLLAENDIPAPYLVVLNGTAGAGISRAIGADAISNYISSFKHETVGPYVDLDNQTRDYWKKMAGTGVPTIPVVMLGWDTRPRQERPVPWEHGTPNPNPTEYYVLPTPKEFAAHVEAAVDFIHDNPTACPSKTLLIYSWDECDEGGGVIPTHGDKEGAYLSAIAPIIS